MTNTVTDAPVRAGGRMLAKPPSMLRTGARLAGEPNEPSVPIDLATEWVKPDAARLQDGGLRRPAPAVQRSKPRDELGELERLGEVVVGAQLEPRDLLAQPAGRGEHQDRRGAVPPGEDAARPSSGRSRCRTAATATSRSDTTSCRSPRASASTASTSQTKQATVSGGLLDDFDSALLTDRVETVGICSKPSMVRLKGLEPLTFWLVADQAERAAVDAAFWSIVACQVSPDSRRDDFERVA